MPHNFIALLLPLSHHFAVLKKPIVLLYVLLSLTCVLCSLKIELEEACGLSVIYIFRCGEILSILFVIGVKLASDHKCSLNVPM